MSASLGWVGLAQWALRWSAEIWPRSGDEGTTGLKLFEALGGDVKACFGPPCRWPRRSARA